MLWYSNGTDNNTARHDEFVLKKIPSHHFLGLYSARKWAQDCSKLASTCGVGYAHRARQVPPDDDGLLTP